MPDGDLDRTAAWSRQLTETHATLRERLRRLQSDLGGETAAGFDADGADGDLLAHCLGFCAALTTHHEGEDSGLFAELLRVRPDLAATVAALQEDHWLIAGILTTVQGLAGETQAGVTAERRDAIRGELDGLAAIMESHFRYEERAIGAALDQGVADTGWTRPVFALRD
ncbi:hemerythrin domain-containing protein [Jiangella mangrovi]|uniref:Hemerythrin-like domain-containing protein n=1 Tax=Jiangella mangrovi TaxID=1524084 RepID=A0A7W9GMP5_9ACTN|nr:hemerythrin domain-containing protein [Jiangella mangrovi]MBB5786366.1 hypothetical protein [Jiangella mangrovi]